MKLWKWTDKNDRTRGGCQWGAGVEHTAPGIGGLCSAGWIHAYEHPLLAVLHDPAHGDFLSAPGAKLWLCDGEVGKRDGQMKCGCTRLKTLREVRPPSVTPEQRVRYAILCAAEGLPAEPWAEDWLAWAMLWWMGLDRAAAEARAAAAEARAAWAAAAAAAEAAWAAATAWAEAARGGRELDLAHLAEWAVKP